MTSFNPPVPKYWESIADQLKADRWSLGWIRALEGGVLLWTVDAKKNGQTHISKAEDMTVAFLELRRSCLESE